MKRNIKKATREGRKLADKRPALDLTTGEMETFIDDFYKTAADKGTLDAVMELIEGTYWAGLAIGNRNA